MKHSDAIERRRALDRLVEVRDGPVDVALGPQGAAAVHVGGPIFRIELERLVIVRDGPVEVAPVVPSVAAVVVGSRIRRIDPHRLVEIRHCAVEVALCLVRPAATRIQPREASTRVLARVDGARAPCDREVI